MGTRENKPTRTFYRVGDLRVSETDEDLGLDESQHNEKYVQGTLLVKGDGALTEVKNPEAGH